jgi:transcriptional regulator with XRE-family HTH domain
MVDLQPSWIPRLRRLIKSKGWRQRDLKKHLGFGPAAVRRVLCGGRPKLLLLENLAALERACAREIAAFERRYVIVRGRKRFVFADLSHPGRSRDLSVLRFSNKL